MSAQASSASPQVTIISQDNILKQQSATGSQLCHGPGDYVPNALFDAGDNPQPDDTTIHRDNELEQQLLETHSGDGVSESFKLRAMLAVARINVALSVIFIRYPRYNYQDALIQLINDDIFETGSFEFGVLAFKMRTEFPDWIQRRVTITDEAIEKSGLELISSQQLEQYEREGKVILNCTQQCLICIDEYKAEEEVRVMNCRHAFHRKCIDEWLETSCNNCPVCRSTGVDFLGRT